MGMLNRGDSLEISFCSGDWLQIATGGDDDEGFWIMWKTDSWQLLVEVPEHTSPSCQMIESDVDERDNAPGRGSPIDAGIELANDELATERCGDGPLASTLKHDQSGPDSEDVNTADGAALDDSAILSQSKPPLEDTKSEDNADLDPPGTLSSSPDAVEAELDVADQVEQQHSHEGGNSVTMEGEHDAVSTSNWDDRPIRPTPSPIESDEHESHSTQLDEQAIQPTEIALKDTVPIVVDDESSTEVQKDVEEFNEIETKEEKQTEVSWDDRPIRPAKNQFSWDEQPVGPAPTGGMLDTSTQSVPTKSEQLDDAANEDAISEDAAEVVVAATWDDHPMSTVTNDDERPIRPARTGIESSDSTLEDSLVDGKDANVIMVDTKQQEAAVVESSWDDRPIRPAKNSFAWDEQPTKPAQSFDDMPESSEPTPVVDEHVEQTVLTEERYEETRTVVAATWEDRPIRPAANNVVADEGLVQPDEVANEVNVSCLEMSDVNNESEVIGSGDGKHKDAETVVVSSWEDGPIRPAPSNAWAEEHPLQPKQDSNEEGDTSDLEVSVVDEKPETTAFGGNKYEDAESVVTAASWEDRPIRLAVDVQSSVSVDVQPLQPAQDLNEICVSDSESCSVKNDSAPNAIVCAKQDAVETEVASSTEVIENDDEHQFPDSASTNAWDDIPVGPRRRMKVDYSTAWEEDQAKVSLQSLASTFTTARASASAVVPDTDGIGRDDREESPDSHSKSASATNDIDMSGNAGSVIQSTELNRATTVESATISVGPPAPHGQALKDSSKNDAAEAMAVPIDIQLRLGTAVYNRLIAEDIPMLAEDSFSDSSVRYDPVDILVPNVDNEAKLSAVELLNQGGLEALCRGRINSCEVDEVSQILFEAAMYGDIDVMLEALDFGEAPVDDWVHFVATDAIKRASEHMAMMNSVDALYGRNQLTAEQREQMARHDKIRALLLRASVKGPATSVLELIGDNGDETLEVAVADDDTDFELTSQFKYPTITRAQVGTPGRRVGTPNGRATSPAPGFGLRRAVSTGSVVPPAVNTDISTPPETVERRLTPPSISASSLKRPASAIARTPPSMMTDEPPKSPDFVSKNSVPQLPRTPPHQVQQGGAVVHPARPRTPPPGASTLPPSGLTRPSSALARPRSIPLPSRLSAPSGILSPGIQQQQPVGSLPSPSTRSIPLPRPASATSSLLAPRKSMLSAPNKMSNLQAPAARSIPQATTTSSLQVRRATFGFGHPRASTTTSSGASK